VEGYDWYCACWNDKIKIIHGLMPNDSCLHVCSACLRPPLCIPWNFGTWWQAAVRVSIGKSEAAVAGCVWRQAARLELDVRSRCGPVVLFLNRVFAIFLSFIDVLLVQLVVLNCVSIFRVWPRVCFLFGGLLVWCITVCCRPLLLHYTSSHKDVEWSRRAASENLCTFKD
jgi:hypothetical protein